MVRGQVKSRGLGVQQQYMSQRNENRWLCMYVCAFAHLHLQIMKEFLV